MDKERIFSRYLEIIFGKNYRISAPRKGVLKVLFDTEHLSVDEIKLKYSKIYKKSVSDGTVYKTLKTLSELNLLKIIKQDGINLYELKLGLNHDHLVCIKCGTIIEFKDDALDLELTDLASSKNFRLDDRVLLLEGVCEKCLR